MTHDFSKKEVYRYYIFIDSAFQTFLYIGKERVYVCIMHYRWHVEINYRLPNLLQRLLRRIVFRVDYFEVAWLFSW